MSPVQPLPAESVLLHIGPHKTGTTAIQTALRDAQPVLRQHGVEVVGPGLKLHLGALYMTGLPPMRGQTQPRKRHWSEVVAATANARHKRVVMSSERFCPAGLDRATQIVQDLGGERVHVVVTLRPLAKILASQWQQRIQLGVATPYHRWLRGVFDGDPQANPARAFWERHDHGDLVARWSQAVGVERLHVVVVDDTDRNVLTNAFERLLDVPLGCLVPEQSNRSLTMAETEVIRQLNHEYDAREWSPTVYRRYVVDGVAAQFKQRPIQPGESSIATPRWAAERAAERAAEATEQITALGVHVIGDLSQLTRPPSEISADHSAPDAALMLPSEAATAGIVGAILAGAAHADAAPQAGPADRSSPAASPRRRSVTLRRVLARLRDGVRSRGTQ